MTFSCELFTKVVGRTPPFQFTTEPDTEPCPIYRKGKTRAARRGCCRHKGLIDERRTNKPLTIDDGEEPRKYEHVEN